MIKEEFSLIERNTPCRSSLSRRLFVVAALMSISSSALAESPFITFDQQHELLANSNPEPLLSIYANGKTRAVYPEFMTKAGVYEWQLTDTELLALHKLAGKSGVQQFDEQAVQEEIEENNQNTPLLQSISDSTTTVINVKSANESGEVLEGPSANNGELQNISFEDVPQMAEQNPDVAELTQLDSLQSRLEAILDQANQSNRIK